jgi:23S rRNA (adenine2503-C2)-methyltransferase
MKVIAKAGTEDIAMVYIAKTNDEKFIEFVESVQPPLSRNEKWVMIVSTLFGCPVKCGFCDAGGHYAGKLSVEDIMFQIDYLVRKRFPDGKIPSKKFKIQFARMGEPSFNDNVLKVLDVLPTKYDAPGLIPSVSTVAPAGAEKFFERLLEIKKGKYSKRFQLQFSIHTTDEKLRDKIIPVKKWGFKEIAEYGMLFYSEGGRKITLNFSLADNFPVDIDILNEFFNPKLFFIKITPVNPTYSANKNKIYSENIKGKRDKIIYELKEKGYETLLSIGELEENAIGSNCGQYILRHKLENDNLNKAYTYDIKRV